MTLYQEELMDHYRYPRNSGQLDNPDFNTEVLNPSCGDMVSFHAYIQNGTITEIKFQGKGCVISQATASMLTEYCKNKPMDILENISKNDILHMVGIQLGPTRLRCALLSLEALQQGLRSYRSKNGPK